jgi:hypothetical protein
VAAAAPQEATGLVIMSRRGDPFSNLDVDGAEDGEQKPTSSLAVTQAAVSEPWWADLLGLYFGGALVVGWIAAAVTFIAVYIAAVASVGWVIGIALGWIPAGIAAAIVGWVVGALWPLVAIGAATVVYMYMTNAG